MEPLVKPTIRYLGIAYAAENKHLDRHDLEVFPVEMFNIRNGELGTKPYEIETSGVDYDEEFYKEKILLGDTIRATFWSSSNLDTSPDLRRGMRVNLYQQGDADKYWWTDSGLDRELTRLETYRKVWSDIPENVDEEFTHENTYYVEVSSHKKRIHVHMADRNGEIVTYDIQADGGNGLFTVVDSKDNIIQMNSAANVITLQNQEESMVEVNREDIHLHSDNSISLTTKDISMSSKNVFIECDAFHLKCPTIFLDGNVETGPLKVERMQGPVLATPLTFALGSVPPSPPYDGNAALHPTPNPHIKD